MPRSIRNKKEYKEYKEYYKQLYANKLDALDAMEKFLESRQLLKWTQEETENLKKKNL